MLKIPVLPVLILTGSSVIYPAGVSATPPQPNIVNAPIVLEVNQPVSFLETVEAFDQFEERLNDKQEDLDLALDQISDLNTKLEKTEDAVFERLARADKLVSELRTYVGRTYYVFSGKSPRGWDCSGLTYWFYNELDGIELPHSASKQAQVGTRTKNPVPGDIVAFYYKDPSKAFHVGIYVGAGEFIHSPSEGKATALEKVKTFAKDNIKVAYIRIP